MTMMQTKRLTLRLLAPQDAEPMEHLVSDKEVADTTLGIPHPYPAGSSAGFIQGRMEAADRGEGYSFAVIRTEDGSFLGVVGLHLQQRHNAAEMGYWTGRPYWGNGYCTEAAARILQFAFEELGLNRVYAAAMTRNPGSYKVMEKLGMKHEGVLRSHIRKGDTYEDLVYYGMLRSEFGA
ncbi:RimJ/RimL family protein N-acetyltransferase [Paenibacillus cellulosilyticus]|uniref:RimJ/RimL family protein N-acetyltransferase n=1 Tax=Paenibacillus cellulosilyticus TaxID=375489 RepID=A0A2V2Z934_9BACL|nr:GNAT family N-acetyltransferase [Paenibacillus cellulosilyticus]PWW08641.1 RimJ/RimL family protein N-acetyltransferase [Paenibacillus cellulosilyticus]QKS48207.1 GNAT family N-acetyltransferase [Paenibacillus cellulosilyticus]